MLAGVPVLEPEVVLRGGVFPLPVRVRQLALGEPLPPEADGIPLPEELIRAMPRRQREFRAGRYCALQAVASFGVRVPGGNLGRLASGAPVWPAGLVGSIAHSREVAVAAVASATDAGGIGIDTEVVMSEAQARSVGRVVAWPAEVAHGRDAGLSRLESLTLVFSAKESVFKLLHPIAGCHIEFHDVRIVAVDGQRGTFTARVVRTLGGIVPAQTTLEGRFAVEASWIHTGLLLEPDRAAAMHARSRTPDQVLA